MNKTYTIQKTQQKELSRNKAIIDYFLIDNQGKQRTVHAVASLGFGKKVKSIRAKYYRETPLVKALSKANNQQRIEVSYTKFNKKPRISLLPTNRKPTSDSSYQDVYNDMMYKEKLGFATPNFYTLGMWSILAVMLWMVYMSISTFS
ncbi:MAG: hypothetical protein V3V19_02470 [Cocleimonas sp.]